MNWFQRRRQKKEHHQRVFNYGHTRIESDELYQLRRRVSDLEERLRDTELMCQLLYNSGPGQPVREEWKGD